MQKILIVLGVTILLTGVLWPWLSRIPLGRLPGDIIIDRPGLKVFLPFTSMLLISGFISLLAWLFRK